MPIINGQKMACEPCIRGHRSTKCNHANERLMVPVRKPGRPLSLCPHPPSRPCGCAGVTAAIPRKQTCRCGSNNKPTAPPTPATKSKSPSPSASTSTSASKPASSSSNFRVQKAPKAASRKPSIDPSSLERIDPSQVNILPSSTSSPYPQTHNGSPTVPNGMANEYMKMPMSPHPQINPMVYPLFPHQIPPPIPNHSIPNTPAAHQGHPLNGGSVPVQSPQLAHNGAHHHPMTFHGRTMSGTNGQPEVKRGGCCQSGRGPAREKPALSLNPTVGAQLHQGNTAPMMSPMAPNQQPYSPYYPQQSVFTYPPQYGSYLQPLLPELWRQAMDSMAAQGMANANVMGPTAMNFLPPGAAGGGTPATPSMGSSHVCTCGDGCQCIGCAAHPYNDATQDYVRSAWNSMMDDSWANGLSPPLQNSSTPNQVDAQAGVSNGNGLNPAIRTRSCHSPAGGGGGTPATGHENGGKASPAPQTPSDTASGAGEEQNLSASDFFFVTYPLTDSCIGDTASCPCGDDCQCFGCVVHGNNLPGAPEAPSGL